MKEKKLSTILYPMQPPICFLCDKDFRHSEGEGGLIYFALTEKDKEWHNKQREKGFVGHPPEAAWFCGDHYPEAKKLGSLTRPEAMKKLREIFSL
ncbi:MAG: hypothetical protein JXJ04_07130 [Spirochaetales bacterium]|nr:hypothetical protein [Spirochaetales bacterium]